MNPHTFASRLFGIHSTDEFNALALELFHWQRSVNPVFGEFVQLLERPQHQPVFLPVSFFRTHALVSPSDAGVQLVFSSSGTTGAHVSRHHVVDPGLYERSFLQAFERFYGNPADYRILALLPSYLEREGSSLVYMAQHLIERSGHPDGGFFMHNLPQLASLLGTGCGRPTLLLGVTYALLDLAALLPAGYRPPSPLIVMETGGMKGRRREMTRDEVHQTLTRALGVDTIHSEYGMTELLSQAYSSGGGVFRCPPWMQVRIRQIHDPFSECQPGQAGLVQVIDLANIHSCAFIETQDLGRQHPDGSFEILGRLDHADIRGCNLLADR
jgi:hypothetical protein